MLSLLIKGFIIGFSIAAPVGPIGLLCIHRSLHHGFKAGFVTGLGAASADGIYGCVAAFGLTFISSFLIHHQFWIKLIGGIFLIYLGIKTIFSHAAKSKVSTKNLDKNLFQDYAETFFLTLTNPMTILSFVAIFAGLGLGSEHQSYTEACILVLGITLGSLLWWLFLSYGVSFILHQKIKDKTLQWINYFSGLIILLFGMGALISLI